MMMWHNFRYSGKSRAKALLMSAVLLTSVILAGCGQETQDEEVKDQTITVESSKPEQGDLTLQNSFIGTISPEDTVTVIPMVAGTVTEANFEVGDTVNAGDILFKIDDSSAQLQLASAKLGKASADLQAASALGPQQDLSLISQQATLDQINNQIDSTNLSIDQSKDSKADYEDQKKDVEDQKSDLDSSIHDYKKNLENLRKLEEQFTSTAGKTTALPDGTYPNVGETFVQQVGQNQLTFIVTEKSQSVSAPNVPSPGDPTYIYSYELYSIGEPGKQGMTHEEVSDSIAALSQAITTMESAKGNLDATINSLDSAISGYDSGIDSAQTALDYLNKTKATTERSNAIQNNEMLQTTRDSMALSKQNSQIAIDSAELALSYYTVAAPISGVIEQKNVKVNDLAANGYAAYTISNKDSMVATFQVSEDIMKTLAVGNRVTVERNGVNYEGVLTEVQNSVNQQSGLFTVKASVMADGQKLANGVSVKLSLDTYAEKNAMLIPYGAVYYEDGAAYVYVVKDGKAVKTPIETGIFDDEQIVVVSGLSAEDDVITTWSPQLADGVAVRLVEGEGQQEDGNAGGTEAEEQKDGNAGKAGAEEQETSASDDGTAENGEETE